MKNKFLFIATMVFCFGSCAQKFDSVYGKPLVVFTETNPWLMVIGSDVPSFVLYENG